VSDRDREMVTLQLRRDGRDAGEEMSAWLDLRDDGVGKELRRYLLNAVTRGGYSKRQLGDFALQVWRGNRLVRTFVTVAKDSD